MKNILDRYGFYFITYMAAWALAISLFQYVMVWAEISIPFMKFAFKAPSLKYTAPYEVFYFKAYPIVWIMLLWSSLKFTASKFAVHVRQYPESSTSWIYSICWSVYSIFIYIGFIGVQNLFAGVDFLTYSDIVLMWVIPFVFIFQLLFVRILFPHFTEVALLPKQNIWKLF